MKTHVPKKRKKTAVGITIAAALIVMVGLVAAYFVVYHGVLVADLKLETEQLSLKVGERYMFSPRVSPDYVRDHTVTYQVDNQQVARVENGEIVAIGAGQTTIKAIHSGSGATATALLTVGGAGAEVESVSVGANVLTMRVGDQHQLSAAIQPADAADPSLLWSSDDVSVVSVDAHGLLTAISTGSCTVTVRATANENAAASLTVTVEKDGEAPGPQEQTPEIVQADGITYVNGILIANKTYSLPADYSPGIDPEAQAAFDRMQKDAKEDGIDLWIISGFRPYESQQRLYTNYVAANGQALADTFSARPGHSEHQTGLAFDLNSLDDNFGETPEGRWLSEHCAEYGFIIRYAKEKQEITGYQYEPWHIRYLGVELAKDVTESGLCLEEYLHITSVYAEDANGGAGVPVSGEGSASSGEAPVYVDSSSSESVEGAGTFTTLD